MFFLVGHQIKQQSTLHDQTSTRRTFVVPFSAITMRALTPSLTAALFLLSSTTNARPAQKNTKPTAGQAQKLSTTSSTQSTSSSLQSNHFRI